MLRKLAAVILIAQYLLVKSELINEPTVTPANPFDVPEEARIIRKQLKKFIFPNLDTVMKILCHRTYDQRKQIEEYYNNQYCTKVNKDGTKESTCSISHGIHVTSIDYIRSLNIKLFQSPVSMLANSIYDTIEGKTHGDIEETICAQDNPMKNEIQRYYVATYGFTMESHFPKYKSQDAAYQEVILKYCWPQRSQTPVIGPDQATAEANALHQIDYNKNKEAFKTKLKELLGKYSDPDLKLIFKEYRSSDQGIDTAVNAVFTGDELIAYNALVQYIEDTCFFYAQVLKDIADMGGNVGKVNRIVLTRCERDLLCILNRYKAEYQITFTKHLKLNLSYATQNHYMMALRYLCGKK